MADMYYTKSDDSGIIQASEKARQTFKYMWRELNWEGRRIIPALDLACVKVAFSQQFEDMEEPVVEHMWINDIYFDGENITGILINDPETLTNVQNGDQVQVPVSQISDWLLASQGKTYGGFTIHHMRSEMTPEELKTHDDAWGLDFGDFNNIEVVYQQTEHPENLVEHPMSINMHDSFVEFLQQYPEQISLTDDEGFTLLHRETIAGNRTSVEILLEKNADTSRKTNSGKTALDYARIMGWDHITPILEA